MPVTLKQLETSLTDDYIKYLNRPVKKLLENTSLADYDKPLENEQIFSLFRSCLYDFSQTSSSYLHASSSFPYVPSKDAMVYYREVESSYQDVVRKILNNELRDTQPLLGHNSTSQSSTLKRSGYDMNIVSSIIQHITDEDLKKLPYLEIQDFFYASQIIKDISFSNRQDFTYIKAPSPADKSPSLRLFFLVAAQLAFMHRQKGLMRETYNSVVTSIVQQPSDSVERDVDIARDVFYLQYLILTNQDSSHVNMARIHEKCANYPGYQYLLLSSFSREQLDREMLVPPRQNMFFSFLEKFMEVPPVVTDDRVDYDNQLYMTDFIRLIQAAEDVNLFTFDLFLQLREKADTVLDRLSLARKYLELYQLNILQSTRLLNDLSQIETAREKVAFLTALEAVFPSAQDIVTSYSGGWSPHYMSARFRPLVLASVNQDEDARARLGLLKYNFRTFSDEFITALLENENFEAILELDHYLNRIVRHVSTNEVENLCVDIMGKIISAILRQALNNNRDVAALEKAVRIICKFTQNLECLSKNALREFIVAHPSISRVGLEQSAKVFSEYFSDYIVRHTLSFDMDELNTVLEIHREITAAPGGDQANMDDFKASSSEQVLAVVYKHTLFGSSRAGREYDEVPNCRMGGAAHGN